MRKEEFCDILGDIDETYVNEARVTGRGKKNAWVKWGTLAACLALVLVTAIPQLRRQSPEQQANPPHPEEGVTEPDIQLSVNEADAMISTDMDVQFAYYDKLPQDEWETVLAEFDSFTGIGYDEFVSKLPDKWEMSAFYSASTRGYKDGELSDEYSLHDYVFEAQTDNGGRATIALCSFEEPLRDCFVDCNNPKQSVINDTSLVVYRYSDCYMVQFSYNNVNYDIETQNITLDELQSLLLGILDEDEAA